MADFRLFCRTKDIKVVAVGPISDSFGKSAPQCVTQRVLDLPRCAVGLSSNAFVFFVFLLLLLFFVQVFCAMPQKAGSTGSDLPWKFEEHIQVCTRSSSEFQLQV